MRRLQPTKAALAVGLALASPFAPGSHATPPRTAEKDASGKSNNGDLRLPEGRCASVFADGIVHARDFAMAPEGTLSVNTWSGRYYNNDTSPPGGFLVALKDTDGDGRADIWSDGSLTGIEKIIASGAPKTKGNGGAMPPVGGVALSEAELKAVATYV